MTSTTQHITSNLIQSILKPIHPRDSTLDLGCISISFPRLISSRLILPFFLLSHTLMRGIYTSAFFGFLPFHPIPPLLLACTSLTLKATINRLNTTHYAHNIHTQCLCKLRTHVHPIIVKCDGHLYNYLVTQAT